ncbi:type II CAAX endopeptidase family protein [Haloglomus litoreum]|uniref:type II CAAX endopeptidase family protein n=1 Tax=Haloglomus litoreum TaxID=3034026 RepID=UPI0023E88B11|nr:type II CAAX endopeptidase family protein [Haloglomus sp. DT116]
MNPESPWQPVALYLALTVGLAWLLWTAGALLLPDLLVAFVLLGAWVPSIVAVGLTYRDQGRSGVSRLLRRLLRWRVGPVWYAVALFGIPAMVGLAAGVQLLLGGSVPAPTFPADLPGRQEYLLLPVVFLVNIVVGGPLAEEVGWRGYLQPLLAGSVGTLPAGLGVGLVWGLWHLPFFVLPGGEAIIGDLPLVWFVPLVTGWSVLFAWVVTRTESLLLAVLLHASINTTLGTLGILDGPTRLRALAVVVTAVVVAGLFITVDRSPRSV